MFNPIDKIMTTIAIVRIRKACNDDIKRHNKVIKHLKALQETGELLANEKLEVEEMLQKRYDVIGYDLLVKNTYKYNIN